jgi:hypothetical protein
VNESLLTAKPVDLPRRGITLSDCVGIVIACAVLFGVWCMRGPLPWLKPQTTTIGRAAASVLVVAASVCVFGLAAAPAIMVPRVVRWGWQSMTVSESAWLIFGVGFCAIMLGVRLIPELALEEQMRGGFVVTVVLTSYVVWFCDFVVRTAAPRREPGERCATGWTHLFSVALWLCSSATVALLWFIAK